MTTSTARRLLAGLFALVLAFAGFGMAAPAAANASAFDSDGDSSELAVDSASGNVFALERSVSGMQIATDLYWVGESFSGSDLEVGTSGTGSMLLAGRNIEVTQSQVAGSVRAAGEVIKVSYVQALGNLTLAGGDITVGSQTTAQGVYAAGSLVSFAGSCKNAYLVGDRITVSGTVDGDLTIAATSVEITDSAVINGTLTVPESTELEIAEGATVAAQETMADEEAVVSASSSNSGMDSLATTGLMVLYALAAHLIIALLAIKFFRGPLERMALMARDRFGVSFLSGLACVFAGPFVFLVLLLPLVTIPLDVLLGIFMVTVFLFAIPLAGCATGIRATNGLHPYIGTIIMTSLLTVVAYLPYCAFPVAMVCTMFVVGCWVQMARLHHQASK